ncbi:MAG: hypothetical protein IJC30_03805 [Alphaproteobacteria bacterium]|nr:hypothetical protein [Alphaproteobacteria bacterium]
MADINVWHMTKTDESLDSFLKNGIRTDVGKRPAGGQEEGCYFFTTKEETFRYADFHHLEKSLIIRVRQPQESITREHGWQHDFERNASMKREIVDAATKTLCNKRVHIDFRINDGSGTITRIYPTKDSRQIKAIALDYEMRWEDKEKTFIYSDADFGDRSDHTGISQALSDELYVQSPEYRKIYNEHLQRTVSSGDSYALKYTGQKELPIAEIILVELQKDGSYKETTLFSENPEKKKELCPLIQRLMDKQCGHQNLMQMYRKTGGR